MLADVLRTDDPQEIIAIGADPRLDRQYAGKGPLLNRAIARRIRRLVTLDGRPLPPVTRAGDMSRKDTQQKLETQLDALGAPASEASIARLAAYVRGKTNGANLGPDSQQAVGALFRPDYTATKQSWKAACIFDASVHRPLSPLARLRELTGSVARSKALLAKLVGNDPSGVHATGIAIHNLVESLKRMRRLAAEPGAPLRYAPDDAAALSLSAPATVLREATGAGAVGGARYREGTLVMLELEAARAQSLRFDLALMSCSWSRCPAHRWVPELLAAVWARAGLNEETAR
jgi:hypothetical protein